MANSKRYAYLDIMRIFCAFIVVVAHIRVNALVLADNPSTIAQNTINVLHQIDSVSVPLFAMITGATFLNASKDFKFKDIWKQERRFLLCLVTFGMLFSIINQMFISKAFKVSMFWQGIKDILSNNLWDHMWYIYMVIGLYLILPLIKPFFDKADNKNIIYLLIILFVFNSFSKQITVLTGIEFGFILPISGKYSMYIFYSILGGLLFRVGAVKSFKLVLLAILGIIILIGIITYAVLSKNKYIVTGITSPINSIMALCIFTLFQYYGKEIQSKPLIIELSALSWGVYIIHPLFINLITRGLNINPLEKMPLLSMPLVLIICLALSLLFTYLARKIPFVKKYML